MSTFKLIPFSVLLLLFSTGLFAQVEEEESTAVAKPKSMIELGLGAGYLFIGGDVDPQAGFGGGIHLRKALDHLFSLRLDLMAGTFEGVNDNNTLRNFNGNWYSGSLLGIVTLNNFKMESRTSVKSLNVYALLGGGLNAFKTDFNDGNLRMGTVPREVSPHVTLGAGTAFRINENMNIGVEYQGTGVFGSRADRIDGIDRQSNGGNITSFRDILNFVGIRLNFNIGNPSRRSEPMYWTNPMEMVMQEIENLKQRPAVAIEDTDDDGVIDAIDEEPDTPPGALVDTKGRTLDSDRDGVPDYKDREPYFTPAPGERVNEEGVVENAVARRGGVSEQRVRQLIDEALQDFRQGNVGRGGEGETGTSGGYGARASVDEWFLPMLHFSIDSYSVKYSDYGTLAGIARLLKANPETRLVVKGYTDRTGPETYNEVLSYRRAKSVIDHLVNIHGIGRGRLVLQWGGQSDALVPQNQSYMNRRVEFRTAGPQDFEMDPPSGTRNRY